MSLPEQLIFERLNYVLGTSRIFFVLVDLLTLEMINVPWSNKTRLVQMYTCLL